MLCINSFNAFLIIDIPNFQTFVPTTWYDLIVGIIFNIPYIITLNNKNINKNYYARKAQSPEKLENYLYQNSNDDDSTNH